MVDIFQVGIGEASTAREVQASGSCDEVHERHRQQHVAHHHHHHHQQHQQQHHHPQHHQIATSAFHISRPSHPISTIISPPPLHHTSIILDDSSYQVSRIMLQNEQFQVISPFSASLVRNWIIRNTENVIWTLFFFFSNHTLKILFEFFFRIILWRVWKVMTTVVER